MMCFWVLLSKMHEFMDYECSCYPIRNLFVRQMDSIMCKYMIVLAS